MIDTHTHISDKMTRDKIHEIIDSLSANNVELIIENAYDTESSIMATELARKYERVYCAVGLHPQEASNVKSEDYDMIEQLAQQEKVVAIGEIGLDYHYEGFDKTAQKSVLIRQLLLADKLKKPVIIHLRDAYEDMEILLKQYRDKINNGILLHGYSGSKEMLERFAFLDPYIAFGGAITFKNNQRGEVIRAVRRDRIVLETDCPYLSPVPLRGQINEPKNIGFVLKRMSEELGISEQECDDSTTENAKRFFRLTKI